MNENLEKLLKEISKDELFKIQDTLQKKLERDCQVLQVHTEWQNI